MSELYKVKTIWTVVIDIALSENITVEGEGATVKNANNGAYEVILKGRFYEHRLIEVKNKVITIYSTSASMIPCYARIIEGKLYLSNIAENLIIHGETVSINTYVLFQNMTGIPYPQSNIFNDIVLCAASSIYSVNNGDIVYKGSQLETDKVATFDEIFEHTKHNFDSYIKESGVVNIPLSGGYDSRLNLCFALDSSSRFGNEIKTYHFYKDDNELSISKNVAKHKNLYFTCKNKNDYYGEDSKNMVFDEDYIRFHNGNYREELPRWHELLSEITRETGSDSIIIDFYYIYW